MLCSAAAEKAGPFDSNLLSKLLDTLASQERTDEAPSRSQREDVRSPTCSPTPFDSASFETFCHDELLKAGGRPALSLTLLLEASTDAEILREKLRPWLGAKDPGSQDGNLPPIFSTQLEDWKAFQHKWQWDNRGKYASDEGFAAFLESQRKRWLHLGETGVVSDEGFEETARHMWKYEVRSLEVSGREGFTAYAQAVAKRLASHHFAHPIQLAEDPRRQDAWTTWVEYLSYVYWWRDKHAAAMKAAEPRYRKAWDELRHFDASPISTMSTRTDALDKELAATRAQLETARQQVEKFIKRTKAYLKWETAVQRQDLRAQWVLEQLTEIDTSSSLKHEPTMKGSSANSETKRKMGDDHDDPPRQQSKRSRQEVENGRSRPDPEPETGKVSDMALSDAKSATPKTTGPELRRSQRRRVGATPEEAAFSRPKRKARGLR